MKPSGRPRPISLKQARKNRARKPVRDAYLAEHPDCEAWNTFPGHLADMCGNRSTEVHEPLTRARGGAIDDPLNMKALCAKHHRWVHEHPELATEMGLLRTQFQGEESD